MRLRFLGAAGFLLAASPLFAQDAPDTRVTDDVARYYAGTPFPWTELIADLTSGDPASRARSSEYLRALLTRFRDDQITGRSGRRRDGSWGAGSQDMAREAREDIVEEIGSREHTDAVLTELEWIVWNDGTPNILRRALQPIIESTTPRSSEILRRIVEQQHGSAETLTRALSELHTRKITPSRQAIERALHSHRGPLRDAAASFAIELGIPVPPPLSGAPWFESEGGKAIASRLATLVGPPLPESARWVEIFGREVNNPDEERTVTDRGWLLSTSPEVIEIEMASGYLKRIEKSGTEFGWTTEPNGSESRTAGHEIRIPVEYQLRFVPVTQEVDRVAAIRARLSAPESRPTAESEPTNPTASESTSSDPWDRLNLRGELSDSGTLTSQFEPFGCSLYEVLLAFRVYQRGMKEEAARLLIPVVNATADDDEFIYTVEWYLGCALGHRMLARFCEHDLAATLVLARRIVDVFPRSPFANVARDLTKQIPACSGDWTVFQLPTAEEWTKLASTLDRDGQIRYLCAHARLVTGAQAGLFKGWPWWFRQTRDPGRANYRATSVTSGWIEVINPLLVLKEGPLAPRPDGTGGGGIDKRDFALLRSCAQEHWIAPFLSAWRDFHFHRNVATSADFIEELILNVGG